LATVGGFIRDEDPPLAESVGGATFAAGGSFTGFTAGTAGRTAGVDGRGFGFSSSASVGSSPALNVGCRDIGS
jgi:hypothetical protein